MNADLVSFIGAANVHNEPGPHLICNTCTTTLVSHMPRIMINENATYNRRHLILPAILLYITAASIGTFAGSFFLSYFESVRLGERCLVAVIWSFANIINIPFVPLEAIGFYIEQTPLQRLFSICSIPSACILVVTAWRAAHLRLRKESFLLLLFMTSLAYNFFITASNIYILGSYR